MSKDILTLLHEWDTSQARITARVVVSDDGRPVLQIREGIALQQVALTGRPDATTPENHPTMLAAALRRKANRQTIDHDRWRALARELDQYQVRRRGFLVAAADRQQAGDDPEAASLYALAATDADHALRIIELIQTDCDEPTRVESVTRHRPAILIQRTLAMAQRALLDGDPDQSIEILKQGVTLMQDGPRTVDLLPTETNCPTIDDLQRLEAAIRARFEIAETLAEQLEEALAREDYERASIIRDKMRRHTN